ncbi:MAG: hypothetical protein ACM3S1_10540 [Hyphomicrobiales bacterium]
MTINLQDVPAGCFVFTSDGDPIGQVQEVRGEYFRVGSGENDVWLRQDAADGIEAGRLILNLEANELESESVMPPPLHQ